MTCGKTQRMIIETLAHLKEHPNDIIYTNSEELKSRLLSSCPKAKVELINIKKVGGK